MCADRDAACGWQINMSQSIGVEASGDRRVRSSGMSVGDRINARAKSRSEKTDELRKRILDESLKLFIEQGYEKTTTRQIVQKAGILNGSLYNIYKGKDDIFIGIVNRALTEAVALMDDCLGPSPSPEQVVCFPTCIQIYASARSPRIAELLSVAHEKWYICKSAMSFYRNWLDENMGDWDTALNDGGIDLKIAAFSGALGGISKMMGEEPGSVSEHECMKMMCKMNLGMFDMGCGDLDGFVDDIIGRFESRDIVICNIRI